MEKEMETPVLGLSWAIENAFELVSLLELACQGGDVAVISLFWLSKSWHS